VAWQRYTVQLLMVSSPSGGFKSAIVALCEVMGVLWRARVAGLRNER